jgi:hypothetical protein
MKRLSLYQLFSRAKPPMSYQHEILAICCRTQYRKGNAVVTFYLLQSRAARSAGRRRFGSNHCVFFGRKQRPTPVRCGGRAKQPDAPLLAPGTMKARPLSREKGHGKTEDLLFFIEVKAVQNAMGERGYDHGRYSDKASPETKHNRKQIFWPSTNGEYPRVPFRSKSLKHSGVNQSNSALLASDTLTLRFPSLRRGQEARGRNDELLAL